MKTFGACLCFFVLSLRILTRFLHFIFLQFTLFILASTDGCVMWLSTMEWALWIFSHLLLHCEPIKWHLLFFRLNRTLNIFAVHTHIEECVCDIPIRERNWSDSHWNSFKMHWNQYNVKFAKRYECFRKADGFDTFECSRKLISFQLVDLTLISCSWVLLQAQLCIELLCCVCIYAYIIARSNPSCPFCQCQFLILGFIVNNFSITRDGEY